MLGNPSSLVPRPSSKAILPQEEGTESCRSTGWLPGGGTGGCWLAPVTMTVPEWDCCALFVCNHLASLQPDTPSPVPACLEPPRLGHILQSAL